MSNPASQIEIRVPDIGDFDEVEVVELLVAPGDVVAKEDSLVTLESDKASMEIPSPQGGSVLRLEVQLGDKVAEGSLLLVLEVSAEAPVEVPTPAADESPEPQDATADSAAAPATQPAAAPATQPAREEKSALPDPDRRVGEPVASEPPVVAQAGGKAAKLHASPLVRGYARDLGVDLAQTQGSGPQGRILVDDVKQHIRESLATGATGGIPPIPEVDFSKFGPVETRELSRIRRVAGANLSRSWLNLPHVTQHEDADITELEAFRKERAAQAAQRGLRLSPLLFVMKAVVSTLREFPDFRSSLAPDGGHLIVKGYYHLGIAVDTENGLVVPVVRDVDRKGVFELAEEVASLAEKARGRKLGPTDLQGACFTISSLGGIGGTAFTPIVNAPEVAILGVSRSETRPVWREADGDGDGQFAPRRILPLSLSYDHRVIDGAAAARFVVHLRSTLSHPANLLL